MDLLNIPGYAEAVVKERVSRDAAFLAATDHVTENIGPFEVVPLTLRQWILLRMMHHPLLTGEIPGPIDLFNFFWLLSPFFNPEGGSFKRRLLRRCRRAFFPPTYMVLWNTKRARARFALKREFRLQTAAKIIDAAREFIIESLQDRPPAQNTAGFEAEYFSDPCYYCALFGREFGWTEQVTMNLPLKRIFQYLNEMKSWHGSKVPLCNPSDRIKAAWMRQINVKKGRAS